MALTDAAIRRAKPADKPYKVADSLGLYLLVNPKGSKLWRLKYRINSIERKLALGSYPDITPAELLHELKHHERRGRYETTKRIRSFASRVFRQVGSN